MEKLTHHLQGDHAMRPFPMHINYLYSFSLLTVACRFNPPFRRKNHIPVLTSTRVSKTGRKMEEFEKDDRRESREFVWERMQYYA